MNEYGGFLRVRRGIFAHIREGRISFLEFAVYMVLLNMADFETGICTTRASEVAHACGERDHRKIKDTLRDLKKKHYINYVARHGSRKPYRILIDKYEPSMGVHAKTRLNAWEHNGSAIPDYVQSVAPPRRQCGATVAPLECSVSSSKDKHLDSNQINAGATPAPVWRQCGATGGGINNKEVDSRYKIKDETPAPHPGAVGAGAPLFSTTPKAKFSPPMSKVLARELMGRLHLPLARSFVDDVGHAIDCAASIVQGSAEQGRDYLHEKAVRAREDGQELSQPWFRNPDGWERKRPNGREERVSASERRTANNIAVYREWCRQEGVDPDGQNGNLSAFNHASRNARVQPKALLAKAVR